MRIHFIYFFLLLRGAFPSAIGSASLVDEEWKKLCKEAELAYCDWVNLSVEQRIVFKILETEL
jgi:hypothetical protein